MLIRFTYTIPVLIPAYLYQVESLLAAKVLGGGSMVNGMVYARGSSYDYDDWAANGATGWSYNDVLPYFLRSENIQIPEFQKSGKNLCSTYLIFICEHTKTKKHDQSLAFG